MKKIFLMFLTFVVALSAACQSMVTDVPTAATTATPPAVKEATFKEISAAEAKSAVENKDAQFIDVRTDAEYNAEHAANAVNFPLDTLAGDLGKLDKSKPVYIICQTGRRSQVGAKLLADAGFTEVYSIAGGTNAWTAEKLPTEKSAGKTKGN